jgi:predicted SAM-dependent methyltransferase
MEPKTIKVPITLDLKITIKEYEAGKYTLEYEWQKDHPVVQTGMNRDIMKAVQKAIGRNVKVVSNDMGTVVLLPEDLEAETSPIKREYKPKPGEAAYNKGR